MGDETESDSKLHIKDSISSRIDLVEESFTCDECGEVLKSNVVYHKHKKRIHCKECGEVLKNKSLHKKHL